MEQKLPTNLKELNQCPQYNREVTALKHLTAVSCSSAPKYIADFQFDKDNPWIKNGYFCFVVMSWIPGKPPSEVWPKVPRSPPNDQVLRIWRAFEAALMQVLSLPSGVTLEFLNILVPSYIITLADILTI